MKKRFKNYTQKVKFIDYISENDYIPNKNETQKLYVLGHDKDSSIRFDVAEALEIWYTPENENYLLNMTHDKDSLVRVAAVDSLKIGRTLETLSRLEELFTDSYYMIRGYAVTSHFNVWVNRFGYNVESMESYRKKCADLRNQRKTNGSKHLTRKQLILLVIRKDFKIYSTR